MKVNRDQLNVSLKFTFLPLDVLYMTTNHHLEQRFGGVSSLFIRHVNYFDEEIEADG